MRRMLKKMCAVAMAVLLTMGLFGCGTQEKADQTTEHHKIGVIVYDINDNEVQMFREYYERYIADCFPVEFLYSYSVKNWEEEQAYLESAIKDGAEGFISFHATNLPEAVKICEDSEVYYMIGSGNYSQDVLSSVENNPWFLGCIGTDEASDYQAGADMAEAFMNTADADAKILVVTGGSSAGNYMHEMRTRGILEKLAELNGYSYERSIDEIVKTEGFFEVGTGVDGITVGISSGYNVSDVLETSLNIFDTDAVLSVLASDSLTTLVTDGENRNKHDIWLGVIDCFSQWNRDLFHEKDAFGNSKLNYVSGKYASIIGPAFAAMYQAVTGHADVYRADGKAFHLNQGFWTADSKEKYDELYAYTASVVNNAYSNVDLMAVITDYTPDASFEDFAALTQAADVESAVARMNAVNK